jgi:hypothetical protein
VVVAEPLPDRQGLPFAPVGKVLGVRVDVQAVPGHGVIALAFGLLGHLGGVVVAKLIGVAAHDPVVMAEASHDLLVDRPAEPVIGLVGDFKIRFAQVMHSTAKFMGNAARLGPFRSVQA